MLCFRHLLTSLFLIRHTQASEVETSEDTASPSLLKKSLSLYKATTKQKITFQYNRKNQITSESLKLNCYGFVNHLLKLTNPTDLVLGRKTLKVNKKGQITHIQWRPEGKFLKRRFGALRLK